MTGTPKINLTELRDNLWLITGTEDARPEDERRDQSDTILLALIDTAEAATHLNDRLTETISDEHGFTTEYLQLRESLDRLTHE